MIYILAGVCSFWNLLKNILVRPSLNNREEKEGGVLKRISLAYVHNLLIVSSFLGRFFGPVLRAGGRLWSWVRCGRRRPKVNTNGLFLKKKEERFNTDDREGRERERKKKYYWIVARTMFIVCSRKESNGCYLVLLDCGCGHRHGP